MKYYQDNVLPDPWFAKLINITQTLAVISCGREECFDLEFENKIRGD